MGLRTDNTGFGDIRIIQDPEEFCYGVDAVLLAHFAATMARRKPDEIADLGTGTGIIPLILSHKVPGADILGVEVQKHSYELCLENAKINDLEDRVRFINCNVRDFSQFEDMKGTFDMVTSNPPYTAGSRGIESENRAKAIARHELEGSLEDFVECAAFLLKDRGEFFMVNRPNRIADMLCSCRENRLEPKEVVFVSGHPGEKPNIVLMRCVKNANRELNVLKPFSVRDEDGDYTEEVLKAYEIGAIIK